MVQQLNFEPAEKQWFSNAQWFFSCGSRPQLQVAIYMHWLVMFHMRVRIIGNVMPQKLRCVPCLSYWKLVTGARAACGSAGSIDSYHLCEFWAVGFLLRWDCLCFIILICCNIHLHLALYCSISKETVSQAWLFVCCSITHVMTVTFKSIFCCETALVVILGGCFLQFSLKLICLASPLLVAFSKLHCDLEIMDLW